MKETYGEIFRPENDEIKYTPDEQSALKEDLGIRAENTDLGSRQSDREGRFLLRTETTDSERQTTQFEYGDSGRIERGKKTDHVDPSRVGECVNSVYSETRVSIESDGQDATGSAQGVLESFGWTGVRTKAGMEACRKTGEDPRNAWLKVISTEPEVLDRAAAMMVPSEVRKDPDGKQSVRVRGDFGQLRDLQIGKFRIAGARLSRAHVDLGPDGRPTKVTMIGTGWQEDEGWSQTETAKES